MKNRYTLAGLFATIVMLSSLTIVAHADLDYPPEESYGTLFRARRGGNPIFWLYELPLDGPYTTDNIDIILFWVRIGEVKFSVPIKTITTLTPFSVEIEVEGSFMKDGAFADDTYLEVQMDDSEWFYAVGPAPMWRRAG